ncbi:MAG: WD40 repeat domain-containing protein [Deltaproteobacteria bacterium]|nr:WD40 repeat domain-containing protein [Deltaproteobacteria bacterium]
MKSKKPRRPTWLAVIVAATCLLYMLPLEAQASRVAAGDAGGNLIIWEFPAGTEVAKLTKVHPRAIKALAYDCKDSLVFTGANDGGVAVCRITEKAVECSTKGHPTSVRALVLAPPGTTDFNFATASKDHTIKLWKINGDQLELVKTLEGHNSAIYAMAFSPDGKHLISAGAGTHLRLWDLGTMEMMKMVKGHYAAINTLVFSPDDKTVATCSNDKTVKLWNAATLEEIKDFKGHSSSVYAVAFSPDGKELASAGSDRTIRVWDVASGKETKNIPDPDSVTVNAIVFSEDGKSLFTGDDSGLVTMWDIASGKKVKEMKAGGAVYSLSLCK